MDNGIKSRICFIAAALCFAISFGVLCIAPRQTPSSLPPSASGWPETIAPTGVAISPAGRGPRGNSSKTRRVALNSRVLLTMGHLVCGANNG